MVHIVGMWTNAAYQGHIRAQFNIGAIYCEGSGVIQDCKKAVHWYRKAADQGFAMAQYSLGHMYLMGGEVAQDVKMAHFLYSAAEAQGFEQAHVPRKELEAYLSLTSSKGSCLDAPPPNKCTNFDRGADHAVKLKPCPRYKRPFYCGKDCQSEHWKKGTKNNAQRNEKRK